MSLWHGKIGQRGRLVEEPTRHAFLVVNTFASFIKEAGIPLYLVHLRVMRFFKYSRALYLHAYPTGYFDAATAAITRVSLPCTRVPIHSGPRFIGEMASGRFCGSK